jgi:nitric oxide dioxygenase
MFTIDIRSQARKLADMLTAVVDALERFEELRPTLLELGRKHAGYKVQPGYYEVLVAALLWAFGQALAGEFSRETRGAWEQLLKAVCAVMLEGS